MRDIKYRRASRLDFAKARAAGRRCHGARSKQGMSYPRRARSVSNTRSSIDLREFFEMFLSGVGILAQRINQAAASGTEMPVVFGPRRFGPSNANEVVIGVDLKKTSSASSGTAGLHAGDGDAMGIHLTRAVAGGDVGHGFPSVTDAVLGAAGPAWQQWRSTIGVDASPERFFRRFRLIVEDVSPDSCLALLVLVARANGVKPSHFPSDWIEHVRRWEAGDVHAAGDPFYSWAVLHSALAHSYFDSGAFTDPTSGFAAESGISDPTASQMRGNPSERATHQLNLRLSQAWKASLCLLGDLLLRDSAPHSISLVRPSIELQEATALLRYEYQQYEQGFQHATCLQLLLPMKGHGGHYKLVDAHFEEERVILGAKKVFLRTDKTRAALGSGYGLMGVYRPLETGSGYDMTVSVDPNTGTSLIDLWQELERREDDAWQGNRPSDRPRVSVWSYRDGKRMDGTASPNEPWYHNDEDAPTLIAAPRQLSPSGPAGTRLTWHDVCKIVWEQYCPVRFIVLRNRDDSEEFNLREIWHKMEFVHGKRLMMARWCRDESGSMSFPLSPTFNRYLAGCLSRQLPEPQDGASLLLSVEDLPDPESFEVLRLPGGYATIHAGGVFLLNDWRPGLLNFEALSAEVRLLAERLAGIEKTTEEVARKTAEIGSYLRGEWHGRNGEVRLLDDLTRMKIDVREKMTTTMSTSTDASVISFRGRVESYWGINSKLEELYDAIGQLEATFRTHSEVRANRLMSILAIYGFPAILFAEFLEFFHAVLAQTTRAVTLGQWTLTFGDAGTHWKAFIVYLVITGLGVLVLRRFLRHRF